jgi:tetratricopeptide (TPR) repeat protein
MRQRSSFARALGAAVLVLGCAASAIAQPGRVGGVVRDDKGEPIKGATITAENVNIGSTFTATTDDKGRFTIIGLRAGQWRFIAQAPGYAPEAGDMPVRSGSPNPPISFALRRTGPGTTGVLSGISARDLQTELSAADALFNAQRWDEAIAAYRAIAGRAPVLHVVHLQIAAAHRARKDYDAAIAAYGEILKADPANEKATTGIALTQLERGDAAAAEATLLRAAQGAAGRDILFSLGEVKSARGQTDEAAQWYQKASAADPSWGKPLYKLGMLAQSRGDSSAAVKYLSQVLAVDPISSEAALAKASLDQLKK